MDVFRVKSSSFEKHNLLVILGLLGISILTSVLLEFSLIDTGIQFFLVLVMSIIVKKNYFSVVLEIKDEMVFFSNGAVLYWHFKEKDIKSIRVEGRYLVFYTVHNDSYSINYSAFSRRNWQSIESRLNYPFINKSSESHSYSN